VSVFTFGLRNYYIRSLLTSFISVHSAFQSCLSKINLPVCNSETTAFKVSGTKTTVCHVTIPTNILQVECTILFLTPNFVLMLQIERKSDDTTTVAKCFHFVVVCSVLLMCVCGFCRYYGPESGVE